MGPAILLRHSLPAHLSPPLSFEDLIRVSLRNIHIVCVLHVLALASVFPRSGAAPLPIFLWTPRLLRRRKAPQRPQKRPQHPENRVRQYAKSENFQEHDQENTLGISRDVRITGPGSGHFASNGPTCSSNGAGTYRSGATSHKGRSANRREANLGCGTESPSPDEHSRSNTSTSMSSVRGAHSGDPREEAVAPEARRRPRARSIRSASASNVRTSRRVLTATAIFR